MQAAYRVLTELTIIVHLLFIVFVIAGGLFVWRKRWLMILHITAILWAIYAEVSPGVICPLTTLENYFALRAGIATYQEDFIARYLVPIIYQENLTTTIQYILAGIVVVINTVAYFIILKKRNRR